MGRASEMQGRVCEDSSRLGLLNFEPPPTPRVDSAKKRDWEEVIDTEKKKEF